MSWPYGLTLDKGFFPVPFFRVNPQIDIPEDSGNVNRLPACVSLGVGFISNEIFSIVLKHIKPIPIRYPVNSKNTVHLYQKSFPEYFQLFQFLGVGNPLPEKDS